MLNPEVTQDCSVPLRFLKDHKHPLYARGRLAVGARCQDLTPGGRIAVLGVDTFELSGVYVFWLGRTIGIGLDVRVTHDRLVIGGA